MTKRALTLGLFLCACSAVPDLHFPLDDAGAPRAADGAAADGSTLDVADGSTLDAGDGAAPTCTKLTAADVCCGPRTCSGDCTASNCTKCENACSANELCCAKGSKVTCTPRSNPTCK